MTSSQETKSIHRIAQTNRLLKSMRTHHPCRRKGLNKDRHLHKKAVALARQVATFKTKMDKMEVTLLIAVTVTVAVIEAVKVTVTKKGPSQEVIVTVRKRKDKRVRMRVEGLNPCLNLKLACRSQSNQET